MTSVSCYGFFDTIFVTFYKGLISGGNDSWMKSQGVRKMAVKKRVTGCYI